MASARAKAVIPGNGRAQGGRRSVLHRDRIHAAPGQVVGGAGELVVIPDPEAVDRVDRAEVEGDGGIEVVAPEGGAAREPHRAIRWSDGVFSAGQSAPVDEVIVLAIEAGRDLARGGHVLRWDDDDLGRGGGGESHGEGTTERDGPRPGDAGGRGRLGFCGRAHGWRGEMIGVVPWLCAGRDPSDGVGRSVSESRESGVVGPDAIRPRGRFRPLFAGDGAVRPPPARGGRACRVRGRGLRRSGLRRDRRSCCRRRDSNRCRT